MPTAVPDFEDETLLKWNWAGQPGDWGYPMSVDGNVYRSVEFKELVGLLNVKRRRVGFTDCDYTRNHV